MALPRAARLSKSSLIETVQKKGAFWKTPFFRIRFLPARFGTTKACIIISKKTEPSAVKRNKMRRIMSDSIIRSPYFNNEKGFLLIVYPNETLQTATFSSIQETMDFSLQKISQYSFSPRHERKNHRTSSRKHSHPNTTQQRRS